MEKKIDLSIIIPSWNTKDLLNQCLRSIFKSKSKYSLEVIVVDNGSTDGSVDMAAKMSLRYPIRIIKNKTNLGFGRANNQGMRAARGRYFLLLNSDTIVKPEALPRMINFLDCRPEISVVGPRLLNFDGTVQPSAGPFPGLFVTMAMLFGEHWFGDLVCRSYSCLTPVDWVMGAAMMIKPEIIRKAGWMDEGIFMYMDEVEWAYRIKKAGYQIFYWPGAEIFHLGRGSSRSRQKAPIINIFRGLIYFYKKHYAPWQLFILRKMLQLKATLAYILGLMTGNQYLKKTYGEAIKII